MKTKKEIEILRADALSGDSEAQNDLGCAYGAGDGVAKNLTEAFKWFSESAKNGNKYGLYNVGLYYQNGYGVRKNMEKALHYYEEAAKNFFGKAFSIIGKLYETGYSTPIAHSKDREQYSNIAANPEEAFYWYRCGANHDEIAKFNYARCFEEGIGTEKDLTRACEIYYSCKVPDAKERLSALLTRHNPLLEPRITKLDLIYRNPFRILGVMSNASDKEIRANASKISAFSKIGKPINFESDAFIPCCPKQWISLYSAEKISSLLVSTDILDSVKMCKMRDFYKDLYSKSTSLTEPSSGVLQQDHMGINEVFNGITPESKVVNSLFWFCNVNEVDAKAFESIKNNDWNTAIKVWKNNNSFSSDINLSILCWVAGSYRCAIKHILHLYSDEDLISDFINQFGFLNISKENLLRMYWDALFGIPSSVLSREDLYYMALGRFDKDYYYISREEVEYCTTKVFNELKEKLSSCWEQARSTPKNNFELLIDNYYRVIRIASYELLMIKRQLGEDCYLYKQFNDDIALDILETAIHINNNYEKWTAASSALSLAKSAQSISINPMLQERCKKNVDIFKYNSAHVQVDKAFESLKSEFDKIGNTSYNLTDITKLESNVSLYLEIIKGHIGKDITLYEQASDGVINRILNLVVKFCNSHDDMSSLSNASKFLESLKKYHMTAETNQRLIKNINIVKSNANAALINGNYGFPKHNKTSHGSKKVHAPSSSEFSKADKRKRLRHKGLATFVSIMALVGIIKYLCWGNNWNYFMNTAAWWIYICIVAIVIISVFIIDLWALELRDDPFDWDFAFFDNAFSSLSNLSSDIERAGAQGNRTYSWPLAIPFQLIGIIILIIGYPIKWIAKLATLIK